MSKFSTFSTFQHFRKFQKNLTSEQNFRNSGFGFAGFPPPRKQDGCDCQDLERVDLAVRKVWEVNFLCFLAEGGATPRNLGPATSQAYLGTDPPWRLTRPEKIRDLRFKGIFRILKLIARYSKYDFWIPGKILD